MTISLPPKPYSIQAIPDNFPPLSNAGTETATIEPVQEKVLWVGCCDSLVSETDCLTTVKRSEIFVHRNLGNRVSVGDVSSGSAIEWAVDVLRVEHIIICGHYDCHLLAESESGSNDWYRDIIQLHQLSDAQEPPTQDPKSRNRHFEELYVLAEVEYLKRQESVQRAMKEWGCEVHAFVYDREIGGCVRLVEKKE